MPDSHIKSTENRSSLDLDNKTQILELESLFEISQLLSQSIDLKSVLDKIMYTIMGRMMIAKSCVLLVHETDQVLRIANCKGVKHQEEVFPIRHFPEDYILLEEEREGALFSFLLDRKLQLLIPLKNDGKLIGLYVLGKKLSQENYTERELSFLVALSQIAASSIQNSLNYERLNEANRNLDKHVHQLTTLLETGQKLNETIDFEEILKVFGRTVMGNFLIAKLAILYKKDETLSAVYSRGFNLSSEQIGSCHLKEIVHVEVDSDLYRNGVRLIFPLSTEHDVKGYILCGEKMTKQDFDEKEIEFIENISNTLVLQLNNSLLVQEQIEKEKLEEELKLARNIQKKLLPNENPCLDEFEIVGSNESSKQVGGDYYDFIDVEDGILGIAIGDVSGKGAAAALLMSNLQASMLALTKNRNQSITDCISQANSIIYKNTTSEKYITFFYSELDIRKKKLLYVNAGHNFPLLLRNGSIEKLQTGGIIVGMMEGLPYESATLDLQKDDVLVMYTDGVTEAMNDKEEDFDEPRLIEVIKKNYHASAEEIHSEILKAVFKFSPNAIDFDDITLIVMKVK